MRDAENTAKGLRDQTEFGREPCREEEMEGRAASEGEGGPVGVDLQTNGAA